MDEKMLTIDLNSQKMIAKAREEGVETMYDRKEGFKAQCGFVFKVFAVEYVEWDHVE